ncbi:hypothetical protein sos41_04240 [Alphaproteobacteria bacterium SO-S41]|nr:hypothetical protein sos41_04240 [Alphaproteobacteria bacterium SO-S41]
MRKFLSAVLVTAIVGSGLVGLSSTASAREHGYRDRNDYVTSYCAQNPRARDCQDWKRNGRSWKDSNYRGFYERNHRGNDNALAALFGIAVSAAIASDNHGNGRDHVRACEATYRSYDRRTDTYVGRNGRRYTCNL